MAVVPDISQLAGVMDAFQALLARAQTEVLDEAVREKLGLLSAQMSQSQGELLTGYPKAMAGLQQRLEAAKQQAQATLEQVEKLRKQADEAEQAQKTPPPPPADEPLDPTLGQTLRIELLDRFGDSPSSKKGATSKNISRSEFYEMLRKSGVIK